MIEFYSDGKVVAVRIATGNRIVDLETIREACEEERLIPLHVTFRRYDVDAHVDVMEAQP